MEQDRYKTNQLLKCTLRSDGEGKPQGIPGELWFVWCGLGRPLGDPKDGEEDKGAKNILVPGTENTMTLRQQRARHFLGVKASKAKGPRPGR